MKKFSKFYPHLLALLGFVMISLIYFYPVLQGKKIYQSDIVQYTGMAKQQNDFRKETGEEPYWTDAAFGGMPTYQMGANYPNNFIKQIDGFLRFLPRPADYLFLYFLGFYILLSVLKIDPLKAFFGALAFGFSTYLIIILGVGHNAKAHAIAYMPLVIAGVLLVFKKRYIVGGLLTMFAAALEIQANHFQMTYYLLFFLLIIGFYYIIKSLKKQEFNHLGKVFGVFIITGILALGANASSLLATSEYTTFSTRGDSDLTINPDGSKATKTGAMSYEYITEYSYGITESLNLIAPRLFGGSNNEKLDENSALYQLIISKGASNDEALDFANHAPTYWGDQPIVAAPAYIGVVVFFLAVLALFVEKRKIKYVFLAGAIFSLLLSYGKNFPLLTDFFIDTIPLYNKFRAVSSIQVLLELCFPVLAVLGLYSFFKSEKEMQWKALWKTSAIVGGIFVILFVFSGAFSYSGGSDAYYLEAYGDMGYPFVEALKEDRKSLFTSDTLRSLLLVLFACGIFWLFIKEKLSKNTTIIVVGIIMILDLVLIDKNYVNATDFKNAREIDTPFVATQADEMILQDDAHFRVFEPSQGMAGARTSYFHKSIGGYSAVKPQRMQQLYDYQIANNNIDVLNMLNVKYVLQKDEEGRSMPLKNPEANGNAWFVGNIKFVNSADEEMKALDSLDTKNEVIINKGLYKKLSIKNSFIKDSTAAISLVDYQPNHLQYKSNNSADGFAVFSEMYYPYGWKVTIDGKVATDLRVNYVLRGLQIPAGKHTIEFKFEPEVVKKGSTLALFSGIGMILLVISGLYFETKKKV